ncbi:MAG: hypothetical protein B7Z59_12940 [Acidiphilium sp. 37-67-22]|nr:MAG: hypothetical protein B7Z59_12940 [Acidiphilium sp. 37-67-22]HQT73364.1 hypothetical protein [Acidiphilium sp.]
MDRLDDRTNGTARRRSLWIGQALALAALALIAGAARPAVAGTTGPSAADRALSRALQGSELHGRALGQLRGSGIVIQDANTSGAVSGASVGRGSVTGPISASNSVNGNAGITTVFQNSGNNALIQNTMTINVTLH